MRYAYCVGVLPAVALAVLGLPAAAAPAIVIRNNHDLAYEGPVTFHTSLPAGSYCGAAGEAEVADGIACAVVKLAARSEAKLVREGTRAASDRISALSISAVPGGVSLSRSNEPACRVTFALAVVPGSQARADDVLSALKPLDLKLAEEAGGVLAGRCRSGDYDVMVSIRSYAGGWLDVETTLTRITGEPEPAYVALVRQVSAPGLSDPRVSWNGRLVNGFDEPTDYHRDWWYARGVDWCSWRSGGLSFAVTSAFTPGLTVEREPGRWVPANRYYVWERARAAADQTYLISEVSGPGTDPKKPAAPGATYVQPIKNEPMKLSWRLAVSPKPARDWEKSHMLVFSGYRAVSESGDGATVDLGVRAVQFGTSYFPYSTLCENHDFYRTPGLDRETWWPFSQKMWGNWRAFIPRMQTDLRIIKAMGFDWVRLHHMELLGQMERANALAFLDWYTAECRALGLDVLADTSGSPQWMEQVASRYKGIVKRIEIENETLIPGIKPGDPERWKACYEAAKAGNPAAEVFLTGNGNLGVSQRLMRMGIPFDRLGLHNYKHGPGWEEALSTISLGIGSWATDIGKPPVLGEFNWKELTRLAPEARAKKFAEVYGSMLAPRAIPEFLQFQFQETMSVNPSICRQGIRHYETIYLDRRPKPEAIELMKLIRGYCRNDSPVSELPISLREVTFNGGKARARFTLRNGTRSRIKARLAVSCYDGADCTLASPAEVTVPPGKATEGFVELSLKPGAMPGAYHFFVEAAYGAKTSVGWGIASNPGAPSFEAEPVLADKVDYPQGPSVVDEFDWSRPICVVFGADAPVLELEMAYLLFNTLQSATGRAMRLCGSADVSDQRLRHGNLVLVGTPSSNPLIAETRSQVNADKGCVVMHDAGEGRQWLLVTGAASPDVEAAAVDVVMRFWGSAKDSAIRVTGVEEGAALGHRAQVGVVNPP